MTTSPTPLVKVLEETFADRNLVAARDHYEAKCLELEAEVARLRLENTALRFGGAR